MLKKLLIFFPLVHCCLILGSLALLVQDLTWLSFSLLLYSIYFFPVMVFRVHGLFYKIHEGEVVYSNKEYYPWWGSHQIQQVYAAIPMFESILRIIPGLYSAWLRLWGAKIGKRIHWTARTEIIDRSLLEVGDHCVFGHMSSICAHIFYQKNRRYILYVRRIKIGKRVLVGAISRLGPGTVIADKLTLPICTDLLLDQNVLKQAQLKKVHYDPMPRVS